MKDLSKGELADFARMLGSFETGINACGEIGNIPDAVTVRKSGLTDYITYLRWFLDRLCEEE